MWTRREVFVGANHSSSAVAMPNSMTLDAVGKFVPECATTARAALERSWLTRIRTLVVTGDPDFAAVCRRIVSEGSLLVHGDIEAHSGHDQGTFADADIVILDARAVPHVALHVRRIRRLSQTSAVLVAYARDTRETERLLMEGADEAFRTPSRSFDIRVRASVRRTRAWNSDLRVALGDVVLDREHRRVWCAGLRVHLAPREYDLLVQLFNYAPRVVERRDLSLRLWGNMRARDLKTTAVYIHHLRAKLAGSTAVRIETVRNLGYALVRQTPQEMVSRPALAEVG